MVKLKVTERNIYIFGMGEVKRTVREMDKVMLRGGGGGGVGVNTH